MSAAFVYRARSIDGQAVAGTIEAESMAAVITHLRTRSLFVTHVAAERPASRLRLVSCGGVGKNRARLAFFRSFAVLTRAGVPIQRALNVIGEQCRNAILREAIAGIANDVEGGSALSSALARRPREFHRLHAALVRAGEAAGALEDSLDRLAAVLEREDGLVKKVRAALAYPCIVAALAVGIVAFVAVTIVPTFAAMFGQLHLELPWTTRFLLVLGDAVRQPWFAVYAAGSLVLAAGAARSLASKPAADVTIDAFRRRLPVVGAILCKLAAARFARTMGLLLCCGVSLVNALELAAPVCGSAVLGRALGSVRTAVREGEGLAARLRTSGVLDPLTVALIAIGEETGAIDEMFTKAADYLDLEVETALTTLAALLEPVLIAFLGAVVAFIVFSIFVPLYSLIGEIK